MTSKTFIFGYVISFLFLLAVAETAISLWNSGTVSIWAALYLVAASVLILKWPDGDDQ